MSDKWSYRNYYRWPRLSGTCGYGTKQSPINIEADTVTECNILCKLKVDYKPSLCNIVNKNNTIILRYDPGSFIYFKEQQCCGRLNTEYICQDDYMINN